MGKKRVTERTETRVPEWVSRAGRSNFEAAQHWSDRNPVAPYGGTLSALPDVNQYIAAMAARRNPGESTLGPAQGLIQSGATGQTERVSTDQWSPQQAAIYMNPYLAAVQQATLREMDRKAQMDQLDINHAAQNARAFGGDRHGIMAAEALRNANLARSDYLDRSSAAGYEAARQGFLSDQARALQASMANQSASAGDLDRMLRGGVGLLDVGRVASGLNAQQVQNLMQTGGVLQNLRQADLDRQYDQFLRMQREPLERYRMLAGILSGTPMDRFGFSQSLQRGGVLQDVLGAGASIASILGSAGVFSERALKRNIVRVGRVIEGVGAYLFRYVWEDIWRLGVMADEVAVAAPHALGPSVLGYRTVNYAALPGRSEWRFFAA